MVLVVSVVLMVSSVKTNKPLPKQPLASTPMFWPSREVEPEVLQSGFWVNFLSWLGEIEENCRQISQRILMATFSANFRPCFSGPPQKFHVQNSHPNLSAFLSIVTFSNPTFFNADFLRMSGVEKLTRSSLKGVSNRALIIYKNGRFASRFLLLGLGFLEASKKANLSFKSPSPKPHLSRTGSEFALPIMGETKRRNSLQKNARENWSQEPKRTHKAKKSHEQHQRMF